MFSCIGHYCICTVCLSVFYFYFFTVLLLPSWWINVYITTDLNDRDNIWHRRSVFIGQVNNVLCYFPRLDSDVRYKLFRSYCSSVYGCELWFLAGTNIDHVLHRLAYWFKAHMESAKYYARRFIAYDQQRFAYVWWDVSTFIIVYL